MGIFNTIMNRGLGLAAVGGGYMASSSYIDHMEQTQSAYYGKDIYESYYAKGADATRTALGAAGIYGAASAVLGGPIGFGIARRAAWGMAKRAPGLAYNIPKKLVTSTLYPSRAFKAAGRMAGKFSLDPVNWSTRTKALAGIGALGGGYMMGRTMNIAPAQSKILESSNVSFAKPAVNRRLNFSTAGLTQALGNRANRRLY